MTLAATILFILIFGLIVFVHELGHYLVAKREGMTVKEFALGFPPRLFSFVKGGTRYALNLFPLGGYVSILGENEEVAQKGSFSAAKPWARFRVSMAGIVMNVLLAFVLLTVWFWLAPLQNTPNALVVASVAEGSAAESADIKMNDFILSAGGQELTSAKQLTEFTGEHKGQEVVLKIQRNGSTFDQSVRLGEKDAPLGISVVDLSESVPQVKWYLAPWYAIQEIVAIAAMTFAFLGGLILSLFGIGKEVSADAVSGPVGIYTQLQQVSTLGLASILRFSALISMAIALFNILPLPALDGGRATFILWEAFTGKKIISHQKEGIIHATGFLLLLVLMVVVTFMDIKKL